MLYSLFTTLIEQYHAILRPTHGMKASLAEKSQDRNAILKECMWKHDYAEREALRKQQEELEANNEMGDNTVDWSTFIVVETIEFNENDFVRVFLMRNDCVF